MDRNRFTARHLLRASGDSGDSVLVDGLILAERQDAGDSDVPAARHPNLAPVIVERQVEGP
jgi:hypothetical protein